MKTDPWLAKVLEGFKEANGEFSLCLHNEDNTLDVSACDTLAGQIHAELRWCLLDAEQAERRPAKRNRVSGVALAPFIAVAAMALSSCSSVPKPAVADGKTRVAANDPERLLALQQRVSQDRSLLTDNNLLRAQVDVLQQKLSEMTSIVRDVLTMPPAPVARPQLAPMLPMPSSAPSPGQPLSLSSFPAEVYQPNADGAVVRVFHKFAKTEFEPTEAVAQLLRTGVRGAEHIEVLGHTDGRVANPIDEAIASERAKKARLWLINNGAEASKISTRAFTVGHHLNENVTAAGRSTNRRVEIDIRNPQFNANQIASSN